MALLLDIRGHHAKKKPEGADKTVVLRFEACPHRRGELNELEDVRERYEEEIVPIPIPVIRYIIKGGYCKNCGKVVYPEVPETLYIAYPRYVMSLPENKIVAPLNDTYDAYVSVGTVVDYLKKAPKTQIL